MMYPKHTYVRSKKLMEAYRKIPCTNCGTQDGTVVGAHMNSARGHKGFGIKADDNKCASLCHSCHAALDQGSQMSRADRERMWNDCHVKTMRELVSGGLWPAGVTIPLYAKQREKETK